MSKFSKSLQTALSMFILCLTAPTAIAQEGAPKLSFSTSVAVMGSGKSELGKGNKLQWYRGSLDAALTWAPEPRTSYGAEFSLGRTHYDFDANVLGRSKLDVDEFSLSLPVNMPFMERGGLFFSPQLSYSGQSGAEFEDSITYGAIGAVAWQMSPNLLIGPGVGVFSTFEGSEDDISLFPFLVLDWKFHDDWSLSTGAGSVVSRGPNLQLSYQASDALKFGVEAGYESTEFRLNKNHPISGGIGKQSHVPIAFTANYSPRENLTIAASVGASLGGNLQFNDKNGKKVYDKDYDITPIFGVKMSLEF
ncbi:MULTISPECIES: DUF6268 family outer membrane beta-barrel protein [Cohaesibacter]|uniref:DUF6268 family outer membrane beta-barrel protein n=1 Tax=Cohaesibacter TaxID=655352 RepID=UPI0010FEC197|nr:MULTISPECIES: DUF6268 family outer membrane beta-barrel protein [Cohaesibacter]TLP48681.1 hypothetical protein FDK21_03200 [Cohaesibacter sp. CAU 1516]